MTFVITSRCDGVCDTACVNVCPVDCIAGPIDVADLRRRRRAGETPSVVGTQLYIDPDLCIFCGACAVECPVDAIFHEDDVPASLADAAARNAAFFATR